MSQNREDAITFKKPSKTKQQFKSDVAVKDIIQKYRVQGRTTKQPLSGDFTSAVDYQTACNLVLTANEAFASLDSKVRDKFSNNPANLLSFMEDPSNFDEGVQLGLFKAKDVINGTSPQGDAQPVPPAGEGA